MIRGRIRCGINEIKRYAAETAAELVLCEENDELTRKVAAQNTDACDCRPTIVVDLQPRRFNHRWRDAYFLCLSPVWVYRSSPLLLPINCTDAVSGCNSTSGCREFVCVCLCALWLQGWQNNKWQRCRVWWVQTSGGKRRLRQRSVMHAGRSLLPLHRRWMKGKNISNKSPKVYR